MSESRLKGSVIVKMIVIGALILALLIPLAMVRSLVSEREARFRQAASEVSATWGLEQALGGPLLMVPFQVHGKDEKGKPVTWRETAFFLPETLNIRGQVAPERRSRGIFDVVVYTSDLHWSGTFQRPSFALWNISPEDVFWDEATLTLGIPDMRGIRRGVNLVWAGRALQLSPGGMAPGLWSTGMRVPISGLAQGEVGETYDFGFDLVIQGSRSLKFFPFGKETTVALRSPWPDPSFTGAFLPESRSVTPKGFEAVWNVPYFGRSYPQQWRSSEDGKVVSGASVAETAFGVDLFLPADAYQKTERSVKYGVLFIVLTFLTFFVYEVLNPFALHPMQYLLVGSALCLFYLLLLSFSEHIPFEAAYAIASAATIALIAGYSAAILRGWLRALGTAVALAVLYGYLYVLLQADEASLLMGSLGLFAILALVMYFTRRIDWYAPRMKGRERVATAEMGGEG